MNDMMNENIRSRISRVSRVSRGSRGSKAFWRRSMGHGKHITVENRLFSEDDDDVKDIDGNYINIDINRLILPLPVQTDESLCRDEYLNKLLKPFKKVYIEIEKRITIVDDEISKHMLTGEGMAILKMIDTERRSYRKSDTFEGDYSFSTTMSREEKERLFAICMVKFQIAAIQFLSVRLKKQLEILMSSWSYEMKEKEVPENFFAWSSDYFFQRNNKSVSVNMDVIIRINSQAVLDSVKYSMDVGQVIQLIKHIVEDYKTEANICESSMAEIKKANFDINSPWIADCEKYYNIYDDLVKENIRLSSIDKHENEKTLQSQINVMEGCLPIVHRYRKGWMHSTWDQTITQWVSKEKALEDEFKSVSDKMYQSELTTDADQEVYRQLINSLKTRIYEWETRFEEEQYNLEMELAKMKRFLDKKNDDKKFLEEQIKMFRERVEVFLEKEWEIEAAMQRLQNVKPVIVKKSKKGHTRGRSKERGAKSSERSEGKIAKSVDKSTDKIAKSVDKSTEKIAESIDKSTMKSSKLVKSKEIGAKSIDKSKKKSAKSADKSNEESGILRDKSIKKSSVISRERSKERSQNRINAKKSREKSVGRIQKLINKTTSEDKNPEEIGKSINTTKSRDMSKESIHRAKSIKTTTSRDRSKEGSVIPREKSKESTQKAKSMKKIPREKSEESSQRAKSMKTKSPREKSKEGSVIPREKSKERSQRVKSKKTTISRDKSKEGSVIPREKSIESTQKPKSIKTTTSRDKSKEGSVIPREKSIESTQKTKSIKTTTSRDKTKEGSVILDDKGKERTQRAKSMKKIPHEKSKEISQRDKSIKTTTSKDKNHERTEKSIKTIVSREKIKESSAILDDKNKEKSAISHDKSKEKSQKLLKKTISGNTIKKVPTKSINGSPEEIQYYSNSATMLGDQSRDESQKSIESLISDDNNPDLNQG